MSEQHADDLKIISIKLDQITKDHVETREKLFDIKAGLYDPDKGIYTQIKDLNHWSEEHERSDSKMREDVRDLSDSLRVSIEPLNMRMALMEKWSEEHEKRDKELRDHVEKVSKSVEPLAEDFRARQSRQKWVGRITATLLTALITGLGGIAWQMFTQQSKMEHFEKVHIHDEQYNKQQEELLKLLKEMNDKKAP